MMLVKIPSGLTDDEYGPSTDDVSAMMKYNEELTKAGVLLALDGLQPESHGARVNFSGGKATVVTDGPFTEAKEIVGGYWVIDVKSKEEAVEWASRCPMEDGAAIEVRQIFETSDFSEDIQAVVEEHDVKPSQQV
jgi:hypothetical protein